jgi:hypothetical protein
MPYQTKYKYSFKAFGGYTVEVRFLYKDYTGGVTVLNPGPQALVMREYNTDADFFKYMRPIQADLQILAGPEITMDEFIAEEDDGIQVIVYFNGTIFWIGWLLQEDYSEPWVMTRHYITLRASDWLGQVKQDPVTQVVGQASFEEILGYVLEATPINSIGGTVFINNLFYDGMLDRTDGEYYPLNQATVDFKTFEGDDNNRILEKINKGWTQTIYQYYQEWWIVRQEEWLHPGNVKGIVKGLLSPNDAFEKSFEVNIGVDEDIKPMAPEMLRSIRRSTKTDRIEFYYRFPAEIFCNQGFLRGALIIPTADTYTIDCWTLQKAPYSSPVAGTASWYRKEVEDVDGNIIDNYMFIAGDATLHWAKSEGVTLNTGDTVQVSVDFRGQRSTTVGPVSINILLIELVLPGGTKYTLDDDGNWYVTTTAPKLVQISYDTTENYGDWKTKEITSKGLPADGTVYIYLLNSMGSAHDANFKALDITVRESSKQPGVQGDFDQYSKDLVIKNNFTEETFLDDSNNRLHKGAIFFDNDLTGDNWYRADFPTERLTFKRHKAIAHMLLNRRRRYKLDVTMRGLTWNDAGTTRPIWLMNRFIFTDDAPTKRFMLVNLQEMDFVTGFWRGTLLETYDTDIDDEDPDNYPTHTFGNIYEGG